MLTPEFLSLLTPDAREICDLAYNNHCKEAIENSNTLFRRVHAAWTPTPVQHPSAFIPTPTAPFDTQCTVAYTAASVYHQNASIQYATRVLDSCIRYTVGNTTEPILPYLARSGHAATRFETMYRSNPATPPPAVYTMFASLCLAAPFDVFILYARLGQTYVQTATAVASFLTLARVAHAAARHAKDAAAATTWAYRTQKLNLVLADALATARDASAGAAANAAAHDVAASAALGEVRAADAAMMLAASAAYGRLSSLGTAADELAWVAGQNTPHRQALARAHKLVLPPQQARAAAIEGFGNWDVATAVATAELIRLVAAAVDAEPSNGGETAKASALADRTTKGDLNTLNGRAIIVSFCLDVSGGTALTAALAAAEKRLMFSNGTAGMQRMQARFSAFKKNLRGQESN